MLNELYQKTLKLAAHKRSNTFLAILSFTESSFFPIPPDVMIAPMVIAKKNKLFKNFFNSYFIFFTWRYPWILHWILFF